LLGTVVHACGVVLVFVVWCVCVLVDDLNCLLITFDVSTCVQIG
jgi:hypothetical protein